MTAHQLPFDCDELPHGLPPVKESPVIVAAKWTLAMFPFAVLVAMWWPL